MVLKTPWKDSLHKAALGFIYRLYPHKLQWFDETNWDLHEEDPWVNARIQHITYPPLHQMKIGVFWWFSNVACLKSGLPFYHF